MSISESGNLISVPAVIADDFICKTSHGNKITFHSGDRCLLLNTSADISTIVHSGVNEPVRIPAHYLTIN